MEDVTAADGRKLCRLGLANVQYLFWGGEFLQQLVPIFKLFTAASEVRLWVFLCYVLFFFSPPLYISLFPFTGDPTDFWVVCLAAI